MIQMSIVLAEKSRETDFVVGFFCGGPDTEAGFKINAGNSVFHA